CECTKCVCVCWGRGRGGGGCSLFSESRVVQSVSEKFTALSCLCLHSYFSFVGQGHSLRQNMVAAGAFLQGTEEEHCAPCQSTLTALALSQTSISQPVKVKYRWPVITWGSRTHSPSPPTASPN